MFEEFGKQTDKIAYILGPVALAFSISISSNARSATPHVDDFISTAERSAYVDFELLSWDGLGLLPPSTTQDGVNVNQIDGEGHDIWPTCRSCWFTNTSQSWYPSGGDYGYTEITRANGSDFQDIGFDYGGILELDTLYYELLDDGLRVSFGSVTMPYVSDGYLGFSGGGFDTVRVAGVDDIYGEIEFFGDGTFQALAIDNIELRDMPPVPIPAAAWLFGSAIIGAGMIGRCRKKVA